MTAKPYSRPVIAIAWGWVAVVALILVWGAVTWAGPYGWVVTWEIENGHAYNPGLTLGVMTLVLTAPSMWVLGGHDRAERAMRLADPERARRADAKTGWWTIGLAVPLALAGSYCLVRGMNAPDGSNPVGITIADLRAGVFPEGPVMLSVQPVDGATYEFTEYRRRSSDVVTTYRGVRPVGDAEGKTGPVMLFTEGQSREGRGEMAPAADGIEVRGFIERNALPDFVRRDFEGRGIAVADQHFVIRRDGPRTSWLVGMGVSYAIAFVMLLVGGIVLARAAVTGRRRG